MGNIGCDERFHRALQKVSERGRGRLVPVKRRATDTTRGRVPVPFLNASCEQFHSRLSILDGSVLHDTTVKKIDDAIGVSGESRIVRDHADGGAFLVQIAQQVHHGLAVF